MTIVNPSKSELISHFSCTSTHRISSTSPLSNRQRPKQYINARLLEFKTKPKWWSYFKFHGYYGFSLDNGAPSDANSRNWRRRTASWTSSSSRLHRPNFHCWAVSRNGLPTVTIQSQLSSTWKATAQNFVNLLWAFYLQIYGCVRVYEELPGSLETTSGEWQGSPTFHS